MEKFVLSCLLRYYYERERERERKKKHNNLTIQIHYNKYHIDLYDIKMFPLTIYNSPPPHLLTSFPPLVSCHRTCVDGVCLLCYNVFCDLYCAAPERRDTCEHSSEAKAFHDYVSIGVWMCLCVCCAVVVVVFVLWLLWLCCAVAVKCLYFCLCYACCLHLVFLKICTFYFYFVFIYFSFILYFFLLCFINHFLLKDHFFFFSFFSHFFYDPLFY